MEAYRAVHEQAFVPIFAIDTYDSWKLLEACLEAGVRVIEYTLRRSDAPEMIRRICQRCPELVLLVGSTLGDAQAVHRARRRHPQLLTLEELAAAGVDGFVSMVGFSLEDIRRFAPTHLVIPAAMTLREAAEQVEAGAQFIKLLGPDLTLTRLCAGPGAYGFGPVFLTGGMSIDRLPDAFAAGACVVGAGFEVILRDLPAAPSTSEMACAVRRHIEIAQEAQRKRWPEMAIAASTAGQASGGTRAEWQAWLDTLPHNHPF